MKHIVNVARSARGLGQPRAYALIRRAVNAALEAEGAEERCEVNVLLTDLEGIRRINRESRGVDSATDVLSFPFNRLTPGAFRPEDCERDPENGAVYLGDMALCLPRCLEQGEELGHGFDREAQYLSVHSALHLLGYDHMDEGEGKRAMRSREKAIMTALTGEEQE